MNEDTIPPADELAEPAQEIGVRTQMICDGVVYDMIMRADPDDPDRFHMSRVQPEAQQ
ncbi:Uncharacterised protein [Brevundimonas diminuta]|jgi:hypothetical protein|nr:Uncharacterised protein [Brevundimonas diminuta]